MKRGEREAGAATSGDFDGDETTLELGPKYSLKDQIEKDKVSSYYSLLPLT